VAAVARNCCYAGDTAFVGCAALNHTAYIVDPSAHANGTSEGWVRYDLNVPATSVKAQWFVEPRSGMIESGMINGTAYEDTEHGVYRRLRQTKIYDLPVSRGNHTINILRMMVNGGDYVDFTYHLISERPRILIVLANNPDGFLLINGPYNSSVFPMAHPLLVYRLRIEAMDRFGNSTVTQRRIVYLSNELYIPAGISIPANICVTERALIGF